VTTPSSFRTWRSRHRRQTGSSESSNTRQQRHGVRARFRELFQCQDPPPHPPRQLPASGRRSRRSPSSGKGADIRIRQKKDLPGHRVKRAQGEAVSRTQARVLHRRVDLQELNCSGVWERCQTRKRRWRSRIQRAYASIHRKVGRSGPGEASGQNVPFCRDKVFCRGRSETTQSWGRNWQ
jgi:hypothetical protein